MARMFPAGLDPTTSSNAEKTLFYKLQDGLDDRFWTVIHTLPWLDDSRPFLQQGECDFLLMHPEKGMLVLEVKSGTPSYNGQERLWYHTRHDGSVQKVTNPFDQARASSHFLNDLLIRKVPGWKDQGLPFGYAVAFPDADQVLGNLPPDMTPDLLILEPDLARLQDRLLHVLGRFSVRTGNIDDKVYRQALEILRPEFRLVPSLKTTVSAAKRELVRLTEQQIGVLNGMRRNSRLYVCGGAGTGKTLLISEEARRMASELKNLAPDPDQEPNLPGSAPGEAPILVLCYNNSLEAELQKQLAIHAKQVEVLTFHGLCRKLVEDGDGKVEWPGSGDDQQKFWDEVLPEQAFDCLQKFPHRYQSILVDEAQDFLSQWWTVVEGLLTATGPDGKAARFYIFGDEGQDLYRRGGQLPFTEPVYELTLNCRNTRQIARWVHEAAGMDEPEDVERLPEGPEVQIVDVSGPDQEVDAVRKILHRLIREQKILPEQIVVLGRHRMENTCFGSVRKKLGNYEIVAEGQEFSPACVRYATIHKFKGLEADFVILVGVGEISAHCSKEDEKRFCYVGGSRGRVGVILTTSQNKG